MIPAGLKEVTAHWLNGALHKMGLLKDIDILSLEIQPMGVGEGFQSDMARLTQGIAVRCPTFREP